MNKQEKLIQEIHNEFDTAQDRLLIESNAILDSIVVPETLAIKDKADKLRSLGFVNTEDVKYSEKQETKRAKQLEKEQVTKELAELIRYYKQQYPFQKFLTENELDRICDKYNLIYAPVSNYVKTVPDKNLKNIEDAKGLCEADITHIISRVSYEIYDWHDDFRNEYMTPVECVNWEKEIEIDGEIKYSHKVGEYLQRKYNSKKTVSFSRLDIEIDNKSGLFIAAPKSHFDLKGLDKKGKGFFKIIKKEIKDPIVFRYCKGGIQVLTMWGDEHFDPNKEPSLVNETLN